MPTLDNRIDSYIEKSADFAKPILIHIRSLIHQAAPEISETMKWSFPHFDHKGTVCSMASFKEHATFGFWKSALMPDPHQLLKENTVNAMGQFGRITSVQDLPPDDIMIDYIRNAVILNETGAKVVKKKPDQPRTELVVPSFLRTELEKHPAAKRHFEAFSYSGKKEYIVWLTEAKSETTRLKRLITAMEWIAEGKARHWKYER